ncbi:conserved Plasmodium protein, unknown function [Plasmodium gallinaceum]|uniref:Nuclear nucleic acid-binding protein C1D n=1 Tax=Plasmodium gallinaceum TaxID=5849 RepID=A0A1J1GQD4_PLAGA|nr:conserved Plasmodium protein, unknown function [Plasmodium gallinaceum]CRG94651.1 conserved Plasmodium protein, unknown function [Plasmodium gallinaceum]
MDENEKSQSMKCKGDIQYEKEKENFEIVKSLNPSIKEFQNNFRLLSENYSLRDLEKELNPVEYADYNSFLAYSICSLFYAYLKISGDLINNHPIKNELKRVQALMKEIKEKNHEISEERSLTINKEASKRIIDSCVSYNKNLKKRKY